MSKESHFCPVCEKKIPKQRVQALIDMHIPEHNWFCIDHAVNKPRKGIYFGLPGVSEMKIVDAVYNDSVRSVLGNSETASAEAEDVSNSEDWGNESTDKVNIAKIRNV